MIYNRFGSTGFDISAVSYGGIVSMDDGQRASDAYVQGAIERGVNYFDVAPSYGDAQEKLGLSLKPFRSRVRLACKTAMRDRAGAERELSESMKLLHTDYFDVYQLHGIASMAEADAVFAPGGAMEVLAKLKEKGVAANIGITAHDEDAALKCLSLYDFDTVLFPFNWFLHMAHGKGARLLAEAKKRGMGILCMKAFIERKWKNNEERAQSPFPKSWCKPIDTEDAAFGVAAMKYALSLGVHTLIPPGNDKSLFFALDHIDECIANPITEAERAFLSEKLESVRGMEFM